jgi:hypothetical protein
MFFIPTVIALQSICPRSDITESAVQSTLPPTHSCCVIPAHEHGSPNSTHNRPGAPQIPVQRVAGTTLCHRYAPRVAGQFISPAKRVRHKYRAPYQ